MSVLRALLVATVVIACLAQEPSAAESPAELSNAVDAFKSDLWQLITSKHFQWVIAVCGLVFGYVALTDGKKFFQGLVLVCVGAVSFCFVLSQLSDWEGPTAKIAKYVASLEVGIFMAFAAKKGWDCTQLLLGLAIGMFIFHNVQGLAALFPQVHDVTTHSVWITALATVSVGLGCWMVDEKKGAGRVMAIVTPLFGSSVAVASIGYLAMLVTNGLADDTKAAAPEAIPSVIEFWNMIVYPMHSQGVGIFHATDTNLTFGTHKFEIDQLLSIFFCVVFALFSIKYQLKADALERQAGKGALKAPLLAPKAEETAVAKLP